MPEHECLLIVGAEGFQSVCDRPAEQIVVTFGCGRCMIGVPRFDVFDVGGSTLRLPFPFLIASCANIGDDSIEPCTKCRPAAKVPQPVKGSQERVLRGFFRLVMIAEKPQAGSVDGRFVAAQQQFKSIRDVRKFFFALFDEFFVREFHAIAFTPLRMAAAISTS